jgi:hypothetical protein
MAVSQDNRGERDRPAAQRPDGSWPIEDARTRRQQRQTAHTPPAPPSTGEPEEDLCALALGLADSMTMDGTPLSQLDTRQELDGNDPPGRPADHPPTAEEIIRALETEQHTAAATDDGSPETVADRAPAPSPHQP